MRFLFVIFTLAALLAAVGAAALSAQANKQQRQLEEMSIVPEISSEERSRIYLSDLDVKKGLASGAIARPIKSILNVRGPLTYGQFVWNSAGIPDGPIWVRIDLEKQILSVFRGGHEIGTSVILHGADSYETPLGTFPIRAKNKDYRSKAYDAPMPYALRLTEDGVAIHGSDVRWGAATHGCIGVPPAFARLLFEQVRLGDPVTVVGSKWRKVSATA